MYGVVLKFTVKGSLVTTAFPDLKEHIFSRPNDDRPFGRFDDEGNVSEYAGDLIGSLTDLPPPPAAPKRKPSMLYT